MPPNRAEPPAGFWLRYAAWSLDALLLAAIVLLACLPGIRAALAELHAAIGELSVAMAGLLDGALDSGLPVATMAKAWLRDPVFAAAVAHADTALRALLLPPVFGFGIASVLWHGLFESSRWQASPGKQVFGLAVVTAQGNRLAILPALLRQPAAALSWLTLNIGHALAALPPHHLALHDRLTRTRVLRVAQRPARLAAGWVGLQLVLFVVAWVWGTLALSAAMQAAMAGALGF